MSVNIKPEASPIVIKKYANRRLYNTATSSYVTLENLSHMVRAGDDFIVYDAKTGDDITRPVLTQIIVEEEQKGENLLPISFLRQLIGLYGNKMQWMVPPYLETAMKVFQRNQEQLRQTMGPGLGQFFGLGTLEEMGKRNMAMFERAMRMWTPIAGEQEQTEGETETSAAPAATTSDTPTEASLRALHDRLNALQNQLEALSHKNES